MTPYKRKTLFWCLRILVSGRGHLARLFQFAVALQAMRADGEVTRMFLRKAFLGTGSNSGVYRLHLLDVPCCNSRTSEHAYAFLAHEQKNLACICNVRTVMLWLGLPLKPLSSNGLPF